MLFARFRFCRNDLDRAAEWLGFAGGDQLQSGVAGFGVNNYRCRSYTFAYRLRGDGQLPIKAMQALHSNFYFIYFACANGKGGFGHSDLYARDRPTNAESVKLVRAATV